MPNHLAVLSALCALSITACATEPEETTSVTEAELLALECSEPGWGFEQSSDMVLAVESSPFDLGCSAPWDEGGGGGGGGGGSDDAQPATVTYTASHAVSGRDEGQVTAYAKSGAFQKAKAACLASWWGLGLWRPYVESHNETASCVVTTFADPNDSNSSNQLECSATSTVQCAFRR